MQSSQQRKEIKKMEKGHIEWRRTDDHRWYAPDRDLLHAAAPLIKSALGATADAFEEHEVSDQEIDSLVTAVAAVSNKALDSTLPETIVGDFFAELTKGNEQLVGMFLANMCKSFLFSYINAIRDTDKAPQLSEEEITSSMRSLSNISLLPPEQRTAARASAMAAGFLRRTYAMSTGMYTKEQPSATTGGTHDNGVDCSNG